MIGKVETLRYVPHAMIWRYVEAGWEVSDSMAGTNHGFWSVLMIWRGEGEPVEPVR